VMMLWRPKAPAAAPRDASVDSRSIVITRDASIAAVMTDASVDASIDASPPIDAHVSTPPRVHRHATAVAVDAGTPVITIDAAAEQLAPARPAHEPLPPAR